MPYVRDIQTDTFTQRSIIDRYSLGHIRANSEESFHAGADLDLFNREMEIRRHRKSKRKKLKYGLIFSKLTPRGSAWISFFFNVTQMPHN